MWTRFSLCFLLIVATESLLGEVAFIENSPGRHLSIQVTDQTNNKTRTLAAITVQTPRTGEFHFVSGGETESKQFVGTRVTGKILARKTQDVKMTILIEIAERIPADDPETKIHTSQKIDLSTELNIGAPMVISLGGNRCCKLRLE